MDIFGDKKYENLDWITKATEPFVYSLNEDLASLPDSYEVTVEDIVGSIGGYYGLTSLSTSDVVSKIIPKFLNNKISAEKIINIMKCYIFQIEGEPTVNLEKKAILNGKILLIKEKDRFSEEELKQEMGREGNQILKHLTKENADIDRLHEMLDLIGGKDASEGLKKRSISGKLVMLRQAYSKIMHKNEWNIRDVDFSNKIAIWISDYIVNGNLNSLTNFCKFKAVTHRGYPIYEIEEEA